jgi:hypothetical protein
MIHKVRKLELMLMIPLLLAGCGDSSSNAIVQGTVTIDGVLAPRGQVTFHPVSNGPIATGPIHKDGSFSLRVGQGNMANPDESTIAPGEYVATVVVNAPADEASAVGEGGPPLAGKRLTAIKYSRKETSGLKYTIKKGRNVVQLELEGSQNDPPPEVEEEADGAEDTEATDAEAEEASTASEPEAEKVSEATNQTPESAPQEEPQP